LRLEWIQNVDSSQKPMASASLS